MIAVASAEALLVEPPCSRRLDQLAASGAVPAGSVQGRGKR